MLQWISTSKKVKKTNHCKKSWTELLQTLPVKRLEKQANTERKSDLVEVALKNAPCMSNKLRTYLQTKLGLKVDYIHMNGKASSKIEAITRARYQVTRLATTLGK